jgi:hypothetical protein
VAGSCAGQTRGAAAGWAVSVVIGFSRGGFAEVLRQKATGLGRELLSPIEGANGTPMRGSAGGGPSRGLLGWRHAQPSRPARPPT